MFVANLDKRCREKQQRTPDVVKPVFLTNKETPDEVAMSK